MRDAYHPVVLSVRLIAELIGEVFVQGWGGRVGAGPNELSATISCIVRGEIRWWECFHCKNANAHNIPECLVSLESTTEWMLNSRCCKRWRVLCWTEEEERQVLFWRKKAVCFKPMPNALALYLQRTSLCLVASLGSNGSHFTSLQGHEHSYSLKKASHVSFFSVCFFTSFVPFFCYLPDPVSTQSSNCVFMCCLHLQWTRDM